MSKKSKPQEMKGTFVSHWDCGSVIETPASVNVNTGEITTTASNQNPKGSLVSEEFIYEDGDSRKVCPECHDHILKPVMVEGVGKQLEEAFECSGCQYAE